jgi:hypothetical protein
MSLRKEGPMPQIFLQQHVPYPTIIQRLRFLVLLAITTYAGWFDLAISRIVFSFPEWLLLSPTFGWSWLFQLFTSAITIPYPGFGLSMVFDLLLINFFLTPIYTFVLSFLSGKPFLKLLLSLIAIGAGSFLSLAAIINTPTPPCSLFGGLSLAFVIFWSLLHRKGQNTLLFVFPISRTWAIALSACVALYSPITGGEWAHAGTILCMSVASYLWGIARWRLRSHIDALEGFEEWLDTAYRTFSRFIQWHVLRYFR